MRAQRITNLQEQNSPRLTSWRAKRKLAGSYQKQDSGSALIILSASNGGYFSYFLFKLSCKLGTVVRFIFSCFCSHFVLKNLNELLEKDLMELLLGKQRY